MIDDPKRAAALEAEYDVAPFRSMGFVSVIIGGGLFAPGLPGVSL